MKALTKAQLLQRLVSWPDDREVRVLVQGELQSITGVLDDDDDSQPAIILISEAS
jgi:hypothetical protein